MLDSVPKNRIGYAIQIFLDESASSFYTTVKPQNSSYLRILLTKKFGSSKEYVV